MDRSVSAREAEVLGLLGKHLTHAEIAAELVLSVRTVESHVASLRRKLDIPGHRELVRYATRNQTVPTVAATSFVGRQRELEELARSVRAARLVSVVGPGGAGKTRLVQQVAGRLQEHFPDGAWFVDLVPVTDADGVAAVVASTCGVGEVPGRSSADAVVRGLAQARALLVLDNCEHVLNAVAALVDRLVVSCPAVRIVVTSRARLALPSERVLVVSGLAADDAVDLLIDRATGAGWQEDGQRERLAAICDRLDGLALAIELAAARLPAIGVDGVERGLADQSVLLVGGARSNERHRSIHDAIDWSVRLLAPAERAALCRVSVFAAGFDADAASAIAGFGTLSPDHVVPAVGRLVDQSLVVAPAAGRWRLLEPVRQFALAAMTSDDGVAFARHHTWACDRAASLVRAGANGGRQWYGAFDDIADDLRSAAAWSPDPAATRLLATLLFRSGRAREAQQRYEQAHAYAHAAAVAKCRVLGEDALRLELLAHAECRQRGDADGAAAAAARAAELVDRFAGMFAGAARLPDDVLAAATAAARRRDEDDLSESAALDLATATAIGDGQPLEAARLARQRLTLFGTATVDPAAVLELKDALRMAILTAVGEGDIAGASRFADRHRRLPCLREQRDLAIDEAFLPEVLAGRWDQARADADLFLHDWDAAGRPPAPGRAIGTSAIALMYGLLGEPINRSRWSEVTALLRATTSAPTGYTVLFDTILARHDGDAPDDPPPRPQDWYGGLFTRWFDAVAHTQTAPSDPRELLAHLAAAVRTDDGRASSR